MQTRLAHWWCLTQVTRLFDVIDRRSLKGRIKRSSVVFTSV